MTTDRPMYRWRHMTDEERQAALTDRQRHHLPWHGPPHFVGESGLYFLTAACYEHRSIIGFSLGRMADFEAELLETLRSSAEDVLAWVVLPNHYHALVNALDIKGLLKAGGLLHGPTSFRWNGQEDCRKRKVWHRAAETTIKSEGHFWATMNYVLRNPVRHGYVQRWQDWPYSSAALYLTEVGREEAERRWRAYPILDYGNDWDAPDL